MSRIGRIMLIGVGVFVALALLITFGYRGLHADNNRLGMALVKYVGDYRSRGKPLPLSVTIDDLVQSGYLQPADARIFKGVSIVVFGAADETTSQNLLVAALLPDGNIVAVMADGSVQHITRARYETYLQDQLRSTNAETLRSVGSKTNQ